jgi:hypothetical protein
LTHLVATSGVRALVILRALLAAGVVNRRVAGIFELGECVVHCIGHGKLGVAIRVLLGDVHGEDILDIASGRFVAGSVEIKWKQSGNKVERKWK